MEQKLLVDSALNMPGEDTNLVADFCKFAQEELKLSCDFKIKVVLDRAQNNIKTTAYFDPQTNEVCVWGHNRNVLDICRSIAHEMVHMQQHDRGLITRPIKDIGGFHEDQANAKAGVLVKKFIYDKNL